MRRAAPALLAALLLATAVPATVLAGSAGQGRSEHDRIVAYWTAARMRAAVPRDFVRSSDGFVPRARPGSGSGVTGSSWTLGGAIAERSGKVYFTMGGGAWVCSGSVASDGRQAYTLVLTAGHCAVDETTGEFAQNWLFIPNYDSAPVSLPNGCAAATYGCWTAISLAVHTGFVTAGGFNTQATVHDFAFAVVGPGGKGGSVPAQLDAAVGSFPITYSDTSTAKRYAFGYPAAGKYHGKDLVYCAGPIFSDSLNDGLTWGMACGMTGGSSGGPWLSGFNEGTGSGTLSSLNSYGYSGLKNMYGPKFNSKTQAVFNAANTADGTPYGVVATGG
jgi:hypothetical protein